VEQVVEITLKQNYEVYKCQFSKMSKVEVDINCFPNASLFECRSNARFGDIVIGGILAIPVLFFTFRVVNEYLKTGLESVRRLASLLVLMSFTFVAIVSNSLIGTAATIETFSSIFYQFFSRHLYSLANCILIEQNVLILCIAQVKGANILKRALVFVRYILILFSVATAFLAFIKINSGPDFNPVQKLKFYLAYINPVLVITYLFIHSLLIITAIVAFVWVERINNLFSPKFIKSMRILLIFITFFFFSELAFITYQEAKVSVISVILIRYGTDTALWTALLFNIIVEYIPKTLFTCALWFISNTLMETEEAEENAKGKITLSQSLADSDELDEDLFPN
jgi:hypothetical protein